MGVVGFKLRKPWQRRLPVGYGGLGGFAGLDLNFASNVYALNGPYSSQFPTGWSFSRTDTNGTATALTANGTVQSFATGVPRITDRGLLVEEGRTNKVTISNANPVSLTGVTKGGDAASVLTLVNDSAALASAGLSGVVTGEQVFRLNNTAGVAVATAQISGDVGNTNAHLVQVYARGSGNFNPRLSNSTVANTALTASYALYVSPSLTPSVITQRAQINAAAGADVYFILVDAQEGTFPTSPIITTGAAGTRGLDAAAITVPAGVSAYTATYNGGLTATGSVTPGASFNLVTGRPWLNGYLQRLVMQ